MIDAMPEGDRPQTPFPVIDEGQDMPLQFYNAPESPGFNRFFIVADQNQQITDNNSSRKEIADCLAVEASEVIELRQNYRNSYPVARLAREFYTGDPASPPPDLPKQVRGDVPGHMPIIRIAWAGTREAFWEWPIRILESS